jgi:hypothetical protein
VIGWALVLDQFKHGPKGPGKYLSPRCGVPCQFFRTWQGVKATKYEEVIPAHQVPSSRNRDLRHLCLGSSRTYHYAEGGDAFRLELAGQGGGQQFHETFLSNSTWPAMPGLWRALEYARHGRSIGGESPLEEEVVLTPSRRQLRRREAGWEGSPRRTSAPRNTNRVEGGAIWVSLLKKVKPVTINRVVA